MASPIPPARPADLETLEGASLQRERHVERRLLATKIRIELRRERRPEPTGSLFLVAILFSFASVAEAKLAERPPPART